MDVIDNMNSGSNKVQNGNGNGKESQTFHEYMPPDRCLVTIQEGPECQKQSKQSYPPPTLSSATRSHQKAVDLINGLDPDEACKYERSEEEADSGGKGE